MQDFDSVYIVWDVTVNLVGYLPSHQLYCFYNSFEYDRKIVLAATF